MADSKKARRAHSDSGEAQVAAELAEEQEQGFAGDKVDPTPNEAYTVAGVTSGEPTPETDAALRAQARDHRDTFGERIGREPAKTEDE